MAIAKMDGIPLNLTFADLATINLKVRDNYVVPPGGTNSPVSIDRITLMDGSGSLVFPQDTSVGISITESPNGIDGESTIFNMFPNPANHFLRISSTNEEIHSISILNLSGQVILNREASSSRIFGLDISEIQNGLYVVCVNGKNGTKHYSRILIER